MGSFIELHVEQGRVLEEAGIDVGVVTAIVGLLQARVEVHGQSDHGGATPMRGRRDALVASARMIVELREWARAADERTVTIGSIGALPGAYNVIPGECTFSLDLRAAAEDDFAAAIPQLGGILERIAEEEESVEVEVAVTGDIRRHH